jgi:hypothetical protein
VSQDPRLTDQNFATLMRQMGAPAIAMPITWTRTDAQGRIVILPISDQMFRDFARQSKTPYATVLALYKVWMQMMYDAGAIPGDIPEEDPR